MEVRWTHTFPEGTSLDDIRAFFCRTASSGLPDAVLKDTSTGDICALAQGPRTSGQYDLLVKQAVKPVVESAWKKPVFKHSEASESEPDSTTKEMDLPDDEETAEPVKVWVHTQALCQYGHWHGTRVSAELCSLCNSCADPGCGGGKWTLRRPPGPSSGKKKLKRFSRIVWRALINRRLHGSFENFTKGLPTEDAVVVSYDPEAKEWNEEPVLVKVETEPFGKGGMRQAYRMKVMRKDEAQHMDWDWAPAYVAKSFLNPDVEQNKCIDDVKQQMLAKHYAQHYNARDPPKSIDFLQASYVKLLNRRPVELMAMEVYMEGQFDKYNNNTGGVLDDHMTPQAFSHYTFQKSNFQQIVVDIQGVDELYTDPQIHSLTTEFGPGDLGVPGMALFAYSHRCNPICHYLGLKQFDLYKPMKGICIPATTPGSATPSDGASPQAASPVIQSIETTPEKTPEVSPRPLTSSGSARFKAAAQSALAARKISTLYNEVGLQKDTFKSFRRPPTLLVHYFKEREREGGRRPSKIGRGMSMSLSARRVSTAKRVKSGGQPTQVDDSTDLQRKDFPGFIDIKPAAIPKEGKTDAMIHFQLARYQVMGRFNEQKEPNLPAALYHYQMAAQQGHIPALLALAKLYSSPMYHEDVLPTNVNLEDKIQAAALLQAAAERGNAEAAVSLAVSFEQGNFTSVDYSQAVVFYKKFLELKEDEEYTPLPANLCFGWDEHGVQRCHAIKALADLLAEGGNGLTPDLRQAYDLYGEAAEAFMVSMKAKLANKCYERQAELEGEIEWSDEEAMEE